MDAVTHVTKVTMPAGEYFVGDPCYSVPDARWSEWLSKAGIDEEPIPQFMVASLDGMAVLGIRVASLRSTLVGVPRAVLRTALLALVLPALARDGDGRGWHDGRRWHDGRGWYDGRRRHGRSPGQHGSHSGLSGRRDGVLVPLGLGR